MSDKMRIRFEKKGEEAQYISCDKCHGELFSLSGNGVFVTVRCTYCGEEKLISNARDDMRVFDWSNAAKYDKNDPKQWVRYQG